MPYYYYWDPTILLILPAMIIGIIAQARISRMYSVYSRVGTRNGVSGYQVANHIMSRNGLNVPVQQVRGKLTDHYDPKNKVLSLSQTVYGSNSVAAAAVAAHECGHALQDADGYSFLKFRSALVPVVNLVSSLSIPLILIGILFNIAGLATFGVIAYSAIFVFQVVTLPVEFNASSRALKIIQEEQLLAPDELVGAKKVLNAAALTYVASTFTALSQLLRLLLIVNRSNNRRRD